jgi:DNA-binding PadR family transcriptional regulator
MSENADLHDAREKPGEATAGVEDQLDQMLAEARTSVGDTTESAAETPDRPAVERTRDAAERALAVDPFRFDDGVVKENLEEILLMTIVSHSKGTHGKQLMDDLAYAFDAHLSPGTVYPALHDLEESDYLDRYEGVRTKRYDLDDDRREEVAERFRHAARQHLVLGAMLQATADELAPADPQ